MRLGQSSLVYVLSRIISSIFGFFATIYLTRLLGESVYGYFTITLALVSWLSLVKDIGFGQAIIKRMSEGEEPDTYLTAGTIIQGILLFPLIAGILVFQPQVNEYVGRPVAEFIVILLILSIAKGIVNNSLNGTHRVHLSAALSTVSDLIQSMCMVALVFLGWGLTGMLSGYALGIIIISIIGICIVHPSPERPSQEHFVRLWNYAKFSWIGSVQSKTFHKADILILGLFVSAGLTGVYAVAYTLATFLGILGSAMNNVFFPEMSRLSAQNKIKEIGSLTNDAVTFSGVFFIPGVVGATVLGDRLLRIYGTSFEKGHWILVILLIALSIYAYTKQLLNALNAVDRPDLAFRANGLFVATNVALNFGLVWAVGWYGAAVATAVSATVGLVAAYYYFYQLVPLSIPIAEIIRQVTAAGIMGIAVAGALALGENSFGWINSHNIVFVILLVTFGAVVYFIVLFFISVRMRKAIKDNILAIFITVE